MSKTTIMIRLDEEDKRLVSDAAYAVRLSMAAWVRNVIVIEAKEQLGAKNVS
jgi:uncharacterized protein (DUF1778 family)